MDDTITDMDNLLDRERPKTDRKSTLNKHRSWSSLNCLIHSLCNWVRFRRIRWCKRMFKCPVECFVKVDTCHGTIRVESFDAWVSIRRAVLVLTICMRIKLRKKCQRNVSEIASGISQITSFSQHSYKCISWVIIKKCNKISRSIWKREFKWPHNVWVDYVTNLLGYWNLPSNSCLRA